MRWWAIAPGPMVQTDVGEIPKETIVIHALPTRKQRDLLAELSDFEPVKSKNRFVRRIKRALRNPESVTARYLGNVGFPIRIWKERCY